MEEKLSETREQFVELKTMVTMSLSTNAEEHTRIFSKLELLSNKIDNLNIKEVKREVSWKTLCKIGVTSVTIITLGITLVDIIPRLIGAC